MRSIPKRFKAAMNAHPQWSDTLTVNNVACAIVCCAMLVYGFYSDPVMAPWLALGLAVLVLHMARRVARDYRNFLRAGHLATNPALLAKLTSAQQFPMWLMCIAMLPAEALVAGNAEKIAGQSFHERRSLALSYLRFVQFTESRRRGVSAVTYALVAGITPLLGPRKLTHMIRLRVHRHPH